MKKAKSTTTPTTRIAIYTRQSVASDLEFGSIDAQREAVEAYVASQRGQGWVALPERYDDHGFSGGNTDRPAFQRLVADIEAGKVDCVCAYKLDRVSRSIVDFTAFVARLEQHGVGFCSVTQAFDTNTTVGKLVMNVLASFGEFERATIAERTRDKIAATRRRGQWTGGVVPLGYTLRDKALVVHPENAELVRRVFRLYLQHGSLLATVNELDRQAIRTRSLKGRPVPFNKNTLRSALTNPVYRGLVRAGNDLVPGRHEAIVDEQLWDDVQRQLREHRRPTRSHPGRWGAILSGILRCARCGAAMSHAANVRGDRAFRYYVCQTVMRQGAAKCPGSRAPVAELEDVVVARIKAIGNDPSVLTATLTAAQQARRAQEPELVAEARRVAGERTQLSSQRANLLDALQGGGVAANAIAGRIAEVDEQLGRLQARHDEVTSQLAAMANDTVDETQVRAALQQFTAAWDELIPRERARVLRLLIDEVRYDAEAGELTISFRDNGIRALSREATARRPA